MTSLKIKLVNFPDFVLKIATAFILFLAPIQPVLIAVSILIIVDCFTGIWASFKKGEKFSSAKFFDSIVKLIFYGLLIIISHMVETHLVSHLPLVELSIYLIVFYEFSSFLENVGVITGRDVFRWFKDTLSNLKRKKDYKETK